MCRKRTSRLYFAIFLSLRQNLLKILVSSKSSNSELFNEYTCSMRILSVRRRKSLTFPWSVWFGHIGARRARHRQRPLPYRARSLILFLFKSFIIFGSKKDLELLFSINFDGFWLSGFLAFDRVRLKKSINVKLTLMLNSKCIPFLIRKDCIKQVKSDL